MKVIMTIRQGNMDEVNFTRELEITPQEYDYLKQTARTINQNGGQEFMNIYVKEV